MAQVIWVIIDQAPDMTPVDIWAKRWVSGKDTFDGRRFTDCQKRGGVWQGIDDGWFPTHYMVIPAAPVKY